LYCIGWTSKESRNKEKKIDKSKRGHYGFAYHNVRYEGQYKYRCKVPISLTLGNIIFLHDLLDDGSSLISLLGDYQEKFVVSIITNQTKLQFTDGPYYKIYGKLKYVHLHFNKLLFKQDIPVLDVDGEYSSPMYWDGRSYKDPWL